MPGRREQLAEMLEPAELSQAGSAIAMLGLADERNLSTGGPWPGAAGQCQDVDLVAGLVLAAGDDGLSDRADGKALPAQPAVAERPSRVGPRVGLRQAPDRRIVVTYRRSQ
jgi:hypothetical protein